MMRNWFSIIRMTISTTIQGNSLKKKKYDYNKIAQVFKLQGKQLQISEEEAGKKYLQYLSQAHLNRDHSLWFIDSKNFVFENSKYNIVEYTKQLIAENYREITPEAQNVIDNFFSFTANVFRQVTNLYRSSSMTEQKICKSLVSIITGINQFFFLMTMNKKNCVYYCRCMGQLKLVNKYLQSQDYFNNYRQALDSLAMLPASEFAQDDLIQIFKNLSMINVHQAHYERSLDLVIHFWKMVDPNWIGKMKYRISFITSMGILGCYDEKFLEDVSSFLLKNNKRMDREQKILILSCLVKDKFINSTNFSTSYQNIILQTQNQCTDLKQNFSFFSKTFIEFYQAGLWIPEYWIKFFSFIQQKKYVNIEIYQLFVINRLLDIYKDQIPSTIIQKGKFLKDVVEKQFTKEEMLKDYYRKQVGCRGVSCQTQLSNALRIINAGSVRSQCLIDFFMVDILINDNYIIQVNGSTHYLYNMNSKKKQYNLKTTFRSKVLKKLGYHLIEVDLDNFSESSYNLVQQVYNIIKKKATQEEDLKLVI